MNRASPPANNTSSAPSSTLSALFGWLIPGAAHWMLGYRAKAGIFFVVITVTFWGGVAVGGVRTTVSPRDNGAWIAAQLCAGPQALVALYLNQKAVERPDSESLRALWPASNISVVYAGIAGLLNLLVIIDALARCDQARDAATAGPEPGGG